MNKAIILIMLICSTLMACKRNSPYYEYQNQVTEFNGNAYQYLKAQPGTYDSLLFVVNQLPDIKLALESQPMTIFALTNENFQAAIGNLNSLRKDQQKKPLYLGDMVLSDLQGLESLVCRYIIPKRYISDDFKPFLNGVFVNALKYNYQMHIAYRKNNASGYSGGGPVSLLFSDTRSSRLEADWFRGETNSVNIRTVNAIINVMKPNHAFGFDDFVVRFNK